MACKFWMALKIMLASAFLIFLAHHGFAQQAARPAGQQPKPDERVVLSVGDEAITAGDVDRIIQALPPQYRSYYSSANGRRDLPQYLIQLKVLESEARKHKLEEKTEVKQAIEIARESILADAERRRIEEGIPVSDKELQELYEKQKGNLEEVRIRRILIRTDKAVLTTGVAPPRSPLPEAEARKKLEDLRKKILAGADFAELAQANSDDLATAGKGGDMGYVNRQSVIPPLINAANGLKPGEVSDIISTPYGLEIIKLEDKRTKTLEEIKPSLEAEIRQSKVREEIAKIQRESYIINMDFAYWGVKFQAMTGSGHPAPNPPPQKQN